MAIEEGWGLAQFGVAAPGQGISLAGSIGYDMNEDFGAGAQPSAGPALPTELERTVQYPGQTGELMMRCDVFTPFVAALGTPLLQLHVVVSVQGTSTILSGNQYVSIGANTGPYDLQGAVTYNGFKAEELTAGTSIYVRMNPWSTNMGRSILSGSSFNLTAQEFRFIGLVLVVPMAIGGSDDYFSAGSMIGKFVTQSDIGHSPADFIYPSAVSYR